jgi:hypothetical protein
MVFEALKINVNKSGHVVQVRATLYADCSSRSAVRGACRRVKIRHRKPPRRSRDAVKAEGVCVTSLCVCAQSLDPTVALSWASQQFNPDQVKSSWGTTFGGSGTTNGKIGAYASKSSQTVRLTPRRPCRVAASRAACCCPSFAPRRDPT